MVLLLCREAVRFGTKSPLLTLIGILKERIGRCMVKDFVLFLLLLTLSKILQGGGAVGQKDYCFYFGISEYLLMWSS